MKEQQLKDMKEDVEQIKRWTDTIDGRTFNMQIILVVGLIFLVILSFAILIKLGNVQQEEVVSGYIDGGYTQRISSDSIMINNKFYNQICDRDLDLVMVGDYVIIENSRIVDGFWTSCDKHRVTLQKRTKQK